MSKIAEYPRIPVKINNPEEDNRRSADGINYLLRATDTHEDLLTYLILVSREFAVLDDNATEAGNGDIEAWDVGVVANPESLIAVNAAAGEVTIGVKGLYEVSTTLVYTGAGQDVQYGLGARHNTVAGAAFSYNLWTNKTSAQSFSGSSVVTLDAGDVISLTKVVGGAMTNISGQFSVELRIPT